MYPAGDIGREPECDSSEPSPSERFQAMLAESESRIQIGAWNDSIDWEHGAREMASFYAPLSNENRLYLEWVYGRISSLFNAVLAAAGRSRRGTWQESGIEMLCGRTIADLQAIGFLINKGYYPQAYGAARMTYECCDLADLFWADPQAGQEWFETNQAHRDFSRRRVRERLTSLGWPPADENDIYAVFCERSHPRWAGIAHTIIEPHKSTVDPLSDIDPGAFHWDAGYWTMAAVWRIAFRLRYLQAGMPPNDEVAAMLTNLNATFYVTLDFQSRKVEELTTEEDLARFASPHDRLEEFLHADGETIARRVERIKPA
jgi:hypothetical protein